MLNAVSATILQRLQVWSSIADVVTPIQKVHVSEQKRLGKCRFSAKEANLEALGYVVPAHRLLTALREVVAKVHCVPIKGTVVAQSQEQGLRRVTIATEGGHRTWFGEGVVAADGTQSSMRRMQGLPAKHRSYQQIAVTCKVTLTGVHQQVAYERFTPGGLWRYCRVKVMNMVWSGSWRPKRLRHSWRKLMRLF